MRVAGGGEESVLSDLRRATGPVHRSMEHGLRYLMSPDLTRRQYRRLLEAFLGFYSPLERRLESAAGPGAGHPSMRGWSAPFRARLLERDLEELADHDHQPRAAVLYADAELPRVSDGADALGVLYVVEGAALGGRVIGPAVANSLGVGPASGGAFFHGSGPETISRWRELVALLIDRPAIEHARIVDAARTCFVGLETWLGKRACLE